MSPVEDDNIRRSFIPLKSTQMDRGHVRENDEGKASIDKEKRRKKGEEERREKETESGRNEELNASFRPSRVLLRSSRSDAESIHVIVPRGGG